MLTFASFSLTNAHVCIHTYVCMFIDNCIYFTFLNCLRVNGVIPSLVFPKNKGNSSTTKSEINIDRVLLANQQIPFSFANCPCSVLYSKRKYQIMVTFCCHIFLIWNSCSVCFMTLTFLKLTG